MVVDDLAGRWGRVVLKERWHGLATSLFLCGTKVHLIKPVTFMNRSGKAVVEYYRFFKIMPDRLLVVHDDIDMAPGRIKLVRGGGTGGHNGIKSLVESLGTNDFFRLKVGIGRPGKGDVHPAFPVEKYVLSDFSQEEMVQMTSRYADLERGVRVFLEDGPEKAMGLLNGLK